MMNDDQLDALLAAHGWQLASPFDDLVTVQTAPHARGLAPATTFDVDDLLAKCEPIGIESKLTSRSNLALMRFAERPTLLMLDTVDGAALDLWTPSSAVRRVSTSCVVVDQDALGAGAVVVGQGDAAAFVIRGGASLSLASLHKRNRAAMLPACPHLEGWLDECEDDWLATDVRELLDGPLDVAWARVLAAARLERFGFDEGEDVTAPSRVRVWAKHWETRGVDAVEAELGVRAGLLLDDLLDAQEAAIAREATWQSELGSVLRRRDDLDAVHVLLRAHRPGESVAYTLRNLDDHGRDVMAALPPWELDEEWLWRISVGLPDAWWVQALPGLGD
jgi:hypothetical protein